MSTNPLTIPAADGRDAVDWVQTLAWIQAGMAEGIQAEKVIRMLHRMRRNAARREKASHEHR